MLQHSMPSRPAGVIGELSAIQERRAAAIELWDGPIQRLWRNLIWYQGRAELQAQAIRNGNREQAVADAFVRCMDVVAMLLDEIGKLEAQARAEIRGMDQWIDDAKNASRIDSILADQFRLQRANMTIDDLDVRDGRRVGVA